MANVIEDKLGMPILDRCVSTTGKYFCFLGTYYNGTEVVFVVGAVNVLTGEIVKRHYTDEHEADLFWSEFKAKMQAPRGESGEDEPNGLTIIRPDGSVG